MTVSGNGIRMSDSDGAQSSSRGVKRRFMLSVKSAIA
jgi:hypothetical protein